MIAISRNAQIKFLKGEIVYASNRALHASKELSRLILSDSKNKNNLRAGSEMENVRNILDAMGTLHVDDILVILGKAGKAAKESLVGSLSGYAKRKVFFYRAAPNTFGLLKRKEK